MTEEDELREKLRKIEALFAGAGTAGERMAAAAARDRVRARLDSLPRQERPVELQFSLGNDWSRRLFVALCRRHGLRPYRRYRQRHTTVMVSVPRSFMQSVLWPEFVQLDTTLRQYLDSVTMRIIREEVHRDTSEAPERRPGSRAG